MRVKDIILVVENERSTKNLIVTLLTANGYSPLVASSEEKTRSLMYSRCPDLVILDLDIPDMDGIETLKELRTWSNMPVIIISERKDEKSKVAVLDMGADDYLEKPFGNGELLARIRTALRHARMSDNDEIERLGKIEIDGLIIDYDTHTVTMKGIEVHMTPHEYKVIALLAMHSGKVLTSEYISREVWGMNAKKDHAVLRVHMANIRRKIEDNPSVPRYIFTELGVGYRMKDANE